MPDWADYQEQVAQFFRSLGMEAYVDQRVPGVRTSHAIDVLVRGSYVGFEIKWIVECKAWQSRIPKEKVLALRQIVDDLGADRGFLMAESGYQSGALEAALVSNVTLTSIRELRERLRYDLAMTKLSKVEHRADDAQERYWNLTKETRIEAGLRPDVGEAGYSGNHVISAIEQILREVRLRGFPVIYDRTMATLASLGNRYLPSQEPGSITIHGPEELLTLLDSQLSELEAKLTHAEGTFGTRRQPRR
jgi:hypothetical protein